MRKHILIIALLLGTIGAAYGLMLSEFKSWDDMIQNSPDIVIAKCISTYPSGASQKLILSDGVIPSEIQVISILKGNTKPGPSHLDSQYWPYPGQQFVIFGSYRNDFTILGPGTNRHNYAGYDAVRSYQIVPLNRDFPFNTLEGKSFEVQMQLIFSNRVSELNEEISNDQKDKVRLEEYFKKQ